MNRVDLKPLEIHLWFATLSEVGSMQFFKHCHSLLTEEERGSQQRFHFFKDQRRYIVTRALVRSVLSRYSGLEPQKIAFMTNRFGRPAIADPDEGLSNVDFNISHAEDCVTLGIVRGCSIGIDVEYIRSQEMSLAVADRFFSAAENAALWALPAQLRSMRFLELWTLKESYVKARGEGLSLSLDRFSFDLREEAGILATFSADLCEPAAACHLWLLRLAPEYLLAICTRGVTQREPVIVTRKVSSLDYEERYSLPILRSTFHSRERR